MQYNSYHLDFSNLGDDDEELMLSLINEIRESDHDAMRLIDEWGDTRNQGSWEFHNQLTEMSQKYPEVVFELTVETESYEDPDILWYYDGVQYHDTIEKVYPHFDPSTKRVWPGIPFNLADGKEGKEGDVSGYVTFEGKRMAIHFSGYTDPNSKLGYGEPVFIEQYDGELRVHIFADLESQEPMTISLDGIKDDLRLG